MTTTYSPRIYVACLASYNNGILHGAWIDAAQDADAIREEVAAMLAASPITGAEEWAIHDTDDFGGIRVGESEDFETVATLAELLVEYGDPFAAWYDTMHSGQDADEMRGAFTDAYVGEYDSPEDWAASWLEDTGSLADVPAYLRNYIDFAAYARDARLGGDVCFVEHGGSTFVFNNN